MVGVEPLSQMEESSHQQMGQKKSGHKYNRRAHITHTRDIPRTSRSGDQGVCTMGVLCTPERQKLLETNPPLFFFLKGAKHRFSVFGTHLGPQQREGSTDWNFKRRI